MTDTSYAQPISEVYGPELGTMTLSGAATLTVIGPKGRTGLVRDITVDTSTSIVGTTSVPEIAIGISSADASYGRFRLGSTASLGYELGVKRASVEALAIPQNGLAPVTLADFAGHISLQTARIPKDTAFTIAVVAGVGSAAGASRIKVYIDWY